MLCPTCHTHSANVHPILGILPCSICNKKHQQLQGSSSLVEFTTDSIREQRKAYWRDILPSHNRGELNKAWLDRWGTKKAKERGFTDSEIKHAKYNWNHEGYYKDNL